MVAFKPSMTARLPTPGGDSGTWGDVLNEFLSVGHDAAGNNTNLRPLQVDKGSVSSGTVTFDASASMKQKLTVGGNLTAAFTGWPTSGTYAEVEIQLVNGGAFTVTWPTVNWLKGDGTSATTFSTMGVTLQSSGTNFVIVWSSDGGSTLYGSAA
jgi:hypothetical protein